MRGLPGLDDDLVPAQVPSRLLPVPAALLDDPQSDDVLQGTEAALDGALVGEPLCGRQPVPETVGEIARCAYESLALKYRVAVEGLEKVKGGRIGTMNIVGGGINNRLLFI